MEPTWLWELAVYGGLVIVATNIPAPASPLHPIKQLTHSILSAFPSYQNRLSNKRYTLRKASKSEREIENGKNWRSGRSKAKDKEVTKEWWLKNHAHLLLVCQSVLFQGEKWIENDRTRKTRGLSSANESKVPIISKYENRCDKTISFFNWGKGKIKSTGEYFLREVFQLGLENISVEFW